MTFNSAKAKRFFDLEDNNTGFGKEAMAGVTTFLASMYIIAVNPVVLGTCGMPPSGVLTSTVLVSAFSCLAMGLYARSPLLLAPGMSLNHLFAYAVVKTQGVPWPTALGCVFLAGLLFLLLTILDGKRRLLSEIPHMLRFGMAGGIGLFIALIGFESAGFVVESQAGALARGEINLTTLTFLAGLFITSVLVIKKVPGGFILGIALTTLMAWPLGRYWGEERAVLFTGLVANPDFSLFLSLDIMGALKMPLIPVLLVFLFSCLFDSLATCLGVSEAGNLIDRNGHPKHLGRSLIVTAGAVTASGLFGVSPATPYIESATGMREGGRTGLTAVVSGLCFLPFLFFSPLLSLTPALATAPVLIIAGVFMLKPLVYVRWEKLDESIPFFLAMILMPLTYSITQGIIWGCLGWTALKAVNRKWWDVPPVLWVMDIIAIMLLAGMGGFSH